MRVFIDGLSTLASETVAAAFLSAGHTVLRPDADGRMSCEALQMLALKADLIVLDALPSSEESDGGAPSISSQVGILSALRHTPFEGKKTIGAPLHTIVRGKFVQRDRQLVQGMAGHGRQVTDIQKMPPANPQNVDQSLARILEERRTG